VADRHHHGHPARHGFHDGVDDQGPLRVPQFVGFAHDAEDRQPVRAGFQLKFDQLSHTRHVHRAVGCKGRRHDVENARQLQLAHRRIRSSCGLPLV